MKVRIDPEFKNLLPPHTEAERNQLEVNCKADPQHERMPPVILWGNNNNIVIDGHTQYGIRKKLGLRITYTRLRIGDRSDAMRHALDVQFGRRNLDASQRAIAYAKLPHYTHGGDRKSDQTAILPLEQLAAAADVSEKTMRAAAKVADKGAAEVIDGVAAGDFAVHDAAAIVELSEPEQRKIADEAKRKKTTLSNAKKQMETHTVDAAGVDGIEENSAPSEITSVDFATLIRAETLRCWENCLPSERSSIPETLRRIAKEMDARLSAEGHDQDDRTTDTSTAEVASQHIAGETSHVFLATS